MMPRSVCALRAIGRTGLPEPTAERDRISRLGMNTIIAIGDGNQGAAAVLLVGTVQSRVRR